MPAPQQDAVTSPSWAETSEPSWHQLCHALPPQFQVPQLGSRLCHPLPAAWWCRGCRRPSPTGSFGSTPSSAPAPARGSRYVMGMGLAIPTLCQGALSWPSRNGRESWCQAAAAAKTSWSALRNCPRASMGTVHQGMVPKALCSHPPASALPRACSRGGNMRAADQKSNRNPTWPHPSLVRERLMGGLQTSAYQKLLLKLISLSEPLVSRAT